VATVGPLAVGVLLAFGWNMLVSQPHGAAGAEGSEPGITQQVGRTVEEVAAKAWASVTPHPESGDTGARAHPFGR
jgi:hypothetical protein